MVLKGLELVGPGLPQERADFLVADNPMFPLAELGAVADEVAGRTALEVESLTLRTGAGAATVQLLLAQRPHSHLAVAVGTEAQCAF